MKRITVGLGSSLHHRYFLSRWSRSFVCLSSHSSQSSTTLNKLCQPSIPSPHPGTLTSHRLKSTTKPTKDDINKLSQVVVPITVKVTQNPDDINVGVELTGSQLNKEDVNKVLGDFFKRQPIRRLAEEQGLDMKLFLQAWGSFKKLCLDSDVLPAELHVLLHDIIRGGSHVDDLFPFFLEHARLVFPHLECVEELKKISDSRLPHNWYPEARTMQRKIVYHAGPTNSGKTYNALKRFTDSESGVYCGPLKLLAVEVHRKTNEAGTPCDLVTGEERKLAVADSPSAHVSCTVEMASVSHMVDVAVVDEIQMIKDPQRGWAWTRALLGIPAKELHLCGEEAAIDIVREMLRACGEEVEVNRYNRLTSLTVADNAVRSLKNVQPGDCIVCFSKADIYNVVLQLERMGHEVAVIYGSLPPQTKLDQASRFNDPNDKCKIMVATDAIGMGLNLSIKRVIFYTITKTVITEKGEKETNVIPRSQALQIGGRAGRFGTAFQEGVVTTFRDDDLPILKDLFSQRPDPVESAGIHPTADQVEMFAYHLPDATLANLLDIFVSLCQVDASYYFMCQMNEFKFLADMIQHIPLPLRTRYIFCCAPINKNYAFVCTMFVKFARMYSLNEPVTLDWLCRSIEWPLKPPGKMSDLSMMEQVFDVLDVYLWLSYRFPDLFPDQELVRDMQRDLDRQISEGVKRIVSLIKGSMESNEPQPNGYKWSPSEYLATPLPKKAQEKSYNLTGQLLASGVLTEKMIERLKEEWKDEMVRNGVVKSPADNPTLSSPDEKDIKIHILQEKLSRRGIGTTKKGNPSKKGESKR